MQHRILFVEDEPDLGNVIKQYLEVMDFEIDWCTNGKTALTTFKDKGHQYNILIVDIQLPGMDGFELAERISQIDNNIPFLFLTARNQKQDRLRGQRPRRCLVRRGWCRRQLHGRRELFGVAHR